MPLDIGRHIGRIRAQPGGNFLAFALKDIQDYVNTTPVVAAPSPTASTTVIGGGAAASTPVAAAFALLVNGASVGKDANENDSLPSPPTGRMNGRWQLDTSISPPNISVNLPNVGGVDARITVTESVGQSSQGELVTFSNVGAVTVILDSTVPGTFFCCVENIGAGLATMTPSTGTINGVANLALTTGQSAVLFFDGTNWWAVVGAGSAVIFVDAETPTDSGDQQHFTLAFSPSPAASLQLFLVGANYPSQFLFPVGVDYTLTGAAIVTNSVISGAFNLLAYYRR